MQPAKGILAFFVLRTPDRDWFNVISRRFFPFDGFDPEALRQWQRHCISLADDKGIPAFIIGEATHSRAPLKQVRSPRFVAVSRK